MSLQRGFKARANRISVRLRHSLGLKSEAPIDLSAIARRLDIPIVPLSSFVAIVPQAVKQLMVVDQGAFSAATLELENGCRIIVHNDSHKLGRQHNNLAHELAHVLLGHRFTLPIDSSGLRLIDRDIEEEANWLGATILLTNEAAMRIVKDDLSESVACAEYGVSPPLLKMRLNASGALIRKRRVTA